MDIKKLRWQLFLLGFFKIPMLGYTRPKLLEIDENHVLIKIKLTRRTRNHLKSMYFGAQAVGADLAGGFLAYALSNNQRIQLVFKDFKAEYHKRPESDVYFLCEQGDLIKQMIQETTKTKERVTQAVLVKAYTDFFNSQKELVSSFELGLSLKAK